MRVAKASDEEFDKVWSLINVIDLLFDNRFGSNENCWKEWDDDNEDKQMILEIAKEVEQTDGLDLFGEVDTRLVLYNFIKRKWREANCRGSIQRIVMDAQVLIDNACDPSLDYLEWRPDIRMLMEAHKEK